MRLAFNLLSLPGNKLYGVGTFLRSMCVNAESELASRNATLTVFHHDDCDPTALFDLKPSERIDHFPVHGRAGRTRRVLWEQLELPAHLKDCDVVFSPNNINPLRLPRGSRSIVTIHDLRFLDRDARLGRVQRAYLRFFTAASVRRAARVITVSATSARQIRERLKLPSERVIVVPNCVEAPASVTSAAAGSSRRFVVLAGLHRDKRIDAVLRGFAEFSRRHDGYRLAILGGDLGALAELRDLSSALGIEPRVEFGGYVDESQKWAALAHCVALVLLGRNEGFGIPVLEAMAVGKPSIVAADGALPEIAGDAGLVVDPADAGAVARAMEALAAGPGIPSRTIAERLAHFDPGKHRSSFWRTLCHAG